MAAKKGQLSILLFLGAILVVGAVLISFSKDSSVDPQVQIVGEIKKTDPIQLFVESCMQQVGRDALYTLALQGGYYQNAPVIETYSYVDYAVYWENSRLLVPSIQTLKNEIFEYVENNVGVCLNNFSVFREQGFDFELGDINGEVLLNQENTRVLLNYPITAKRGEEITVLTDFEASIDVKFKEKYDYVQDIFDQQQNTPNSIPFGYMINLGYSEGFTFETLALDSNTMLFSLIFEEGQDPLIYSYVARYDWSTLTNSQKVFLEPIPPILIDGSEELFTYQVKATGENVIFSDNTDLFDIDPSSGLITLFAPGLTNGQRHIMIKAEDNEGNTDFAHVRLTVDLEKSNPVIEPIGDFSARVGEPFSYTVSLAESNEDFVSFIDDTNLFDIHPLTGQIEFTPTETGEHIIKITAVTKTGHAFAYMELDIQ